MSEWLSWNTSSSKPTQQLDEMLPRRQVKHRISCVISGPALLLGCTTPSSVTNMARWLVSQCVCQPMLIVCEDVFLRGTFHNYENLMSSGGLADWADCWPNAIDHTGPDSAFVFKRTGGSGQAGARCTLRLQIQPGRLKCSYIVGDCMLDHIDGVADAGQAATAGPCLIWCLHWRMFTSPRIASIAQLRAQTIIR